MERSTLGLAELEATADIGGCAGVAVAVGAAMVVALPGSDAKGEAWAEAGAVEAGPTVLELGKPDGA